ncbi:MAG: hypothetical protein WBS20_11860, partial [Lysobacterales bacterium]
QFYTQDGLAVAGGDPALGEDDYVAVTAEDAPPLEWADGEGGERLINVLINPDGVVEPPEDFQVILEAVSDESLGIASAQVIIISEFVELIFKDGFE